MFPYIHIPSFKFGPFSFQAFGLLVATGVIVAARLTQSWTEKQKLDLDLMLDSFFWILPGGFIISHIVSVLLYEPARALQHPLHLLYFWEGISSFGGFLGGLLIAYFYFRHRKVEPRPYMETLSFGVIAGYLFGRLGCTVAHDHPGLWVIRRPDNPMLIGEHAGRLVALPSWDSPKLWLALLVLTFIAGLVISRIREKPFFERWNLVGMALFVALFYFVYPYIPAFIKLFAVSWPTSWRNIPYHHFVLITPDKYPTRWRFDLGLIEAFYFMFLFALMVFFRSGKPRKEGFILGLWFVLYAPVRFFLDFLRLSSTDARSPVTGLTPGQYMALLTLALGIYFLLTLPERRWGDYGAAQEEETKRREEEKKRKKESTKKKSGEKTSLEEEMPENRKKKSSKKKQDATTSASKKKDKSSKKSKKKKKSKSS